MVVNRYVSADSKYQVSGWSEDPCRKLKPPEAVFTFNKVKKKTV